MFNGLVAWFSSSVDRKVRQDWKSEGGFIKDIDDAHFIFSNDSETDDTKCLYKSEAYLNEHLAIFHSQYIVDCLNQGKKQDIILGKYFLPPLPVQRFMKKDMKFNWEDNSCNKPLPYKHIAKSSEKSRGHNSSPSKSTQTTVNSNRNVRTRSTEPVQNDKSDSNGVLYIDNLPQVKGQLEDFVPGKNGCEVYLKSS